MKTVGRVLRLLRLAALLTLDEAAVAMSISPERLRDLEAGRDLPDCFETADLAKPYMLGSLDLVKHLRAAAAHEAAASLPSEPFPWPYPPDGEGGGPGDEPTDAEMSSDAAA
jgi:helix-turn-helix protein